MATDPTIVLVALTRDDARAIHLWLLLQRSRPPVANHFRRCLSEEIIISKPMAYVVMENEAAAEMLEWMRDSSDVPEAVAALFNSLADKLNR